MTDCLDKHKQKKMDQMAASTQLCNNLSSDDMEKIISSAGLPKPMDRNRQCNFSFFYEFQELTGQKKNELFQALCYFRPDLKETAIKTGYFAYFSLEVIESPSKSLVRILRNEIAQEQWQTMGMNIPEVKNAHTIEDKILALVRTEYLSLDLELLCKLMESIERNDIAKSIRIIQPSIKDLDNDLFFTRLRRELETREKDFTNMERPLKDHIIRNNSMIKQMLDDEESVSIESVFVPLMILRGKLRELNLEDETTYEISYLRKIATKQSQIIPIDFKLELKQYQPKFTSDDGSEINSPQIWCLIGNPGSGKTFLCHRTALRFGMGELSQFTYAICISCQDPKWHSMESARIQTDKPIDSDFVEDWLCLGLPVGTSWIYDLTEHIVEKFGQGLLLIIDSMDEYIKDLPFKKTLLYLLLTRRVLRQSTILLTSRPGAITTISSQHYLSINRHYHVLGFSPENRDLYFQRQLEDDTKLEEWRTLIYLHDEINQLSLIPVNASLFANLIKELDKLSEQTLTQLYSHLIIYLIRRQLIRMSLKNLAKKTTELSQLHPNVRECLTNIGEIAYQGVAFRELISSKFVTLRVGNKDKACQCLGLAHEHIQKDSMGVLRKVWSFAHLTILECVGAFWLSVSSRGDQCLSVRYIVNSDDIFSLFKTLVRFLCGLLLDRADAVVYIFYKHLPNIPLPIHNLPMCYQLDYASESFFEYHNETSLHSIMGWAEFTTKYLTLSALLSECNSKSILSYFLNFKQFLPKEIFFYFESSIAPNEWESFVRFLPLLKSIRLILIHTEYVTVPQFRLLSMKLYSCSLGCLALKLENKNYSTIYDYCDVIRQSQLYTTKLSLDFDQCQLDNIELPVYLSTLIQSIKFSSLRLRNNRLSAECLDKLSYQLTHLDYFHFLPHYYSNYSDYDILLPQLTSATQLTGLHLYDIPTECELQLKIILPHIGTSNISYLHLRFDLEDVDPTNRTKRSALSSLLINNKHTLRGLMLHKLQNIGFSCFDELLISFLCCTNLVEIKLHNTELRTDDIALWCELAKQLSHLVYLRLFKVFLYDSGISELCKGLTFHPTIRELYVSNCKLTSSSCLPLMYLLPTLKHLEKLTTNGLLEPDPEPIKLLKKTADLYSVNHMLD